MTCLKPRRAKPRRQGEVESAAKRRSRQRGAVEETRPTSRSGQAGEGCRRVEAGGKKVAAPRRGEKAGREEGSSQEEVISSCSELVEACLSLYSRRGRVGFLVSADVSGGMMAAKQQPRIAVLLPCYNEEAAIGATVEVSARRCRCDHLCLRQQQPRQDEDRSCRGGRDRPTETQQAKAMLCGECSPTSKPTFTMRDGRLTTTPEPRCGWQS